MEEKKKELQKNLINSLELQKKIKILFGSNSPNLINDVKAVLNQLKENSKESSKLCDELQHDHGKSLTGFNNCFIDWNELVLKYYNSTKSITEELKDQSEPIEKRLIEIRKIAQSFKDSSLDTRSIELLANIYSKTNQLDKEIKILERAVSMEKTPQRSIALFDSYLRKLEFTYQDRDRIYQLNNNNNNNNNNQQPTTTTNNQQEQQSVKPDDDNGFMKLHADAWEIYLWLKSMPGFPRDQFLLQRKSSMFKLCLYIGSLANPLISAKDKDVVSIAMEAFDEALHLADITQNKEYFCAATAHKSSVVYRTLPEDERIKLLNSLKQVEAEMTPENSEIRDLINSIENKNPSLHPELKEKEDKEKQQQQQQQQI